MRRILVPLAILAVLAGGTLAVVPSAQALDPHDWPAPAPYSPSASASSDGDFATDMYGDPWDFQNDEDVPPTNEVGVQFPNGQVQRVDANLDGTPGGWLRVPVKGGTEVRLVFDWPGVVPWGRDGRHISVDADRYTQLSFSVCNRGPAVGMGVRWERSVGDRGQTGIILPAGCAVTTVNLAAPANAQLPAPWAGTVTRLAFETSPAQPASTWEIDWVRLHRAGTPDTPPAVPHPQVLTPSENGQDDWATTVRGDAWDFDQAGDASLSNISGGVSGGALNGVNTNNDPSVEFAVPAPIDGSAYHRATVDICYDGGFSLADTAGGGMVGRFHWISSDSGDWTESQDIVVFPGCQHIAIDLRADPPTQIHDESSARRVGFCGQNILRFAFDPHEDRAARGFHIYDVKLSGDPHFTSAYPISFQDTSGRATSAQVFVSPDPNAYDGGTLVGSLGVSGTGAQTFSWNGHDAAGNQMPAGSYWVYVKESGGQAVQSIRSTAPVRYDPPGGSGLGEFVGIQPLRVLDTRSGPLADQGCHASAFGGETISVQMAGRGEIPVGQVTAVALNVTVVDPTSAPYLTVWPSGTPRPLASNLNATPGQTIPNMVIAKVGADGKVNIFNSVGHSDVVVDVLGYFQPANGDRLTPIAPVRTLDTRPGTSVGGRTTPLGGGQQLDVTTVPACGADATGAALNVTAVSPTANTYLTVWPAGTARPLASNLNANAGQVIPNMVMVKTTRGAASIFNFAGTTDVVVDVIGCFGGSGSALSPIVPVRALDTRGGTGGHPGPLGSGETATVGVTGLAGVPANGVTAVALNVTGVSPTANTYLTVWPAGIPRPLASNLNLVPGAVQPNLVIAKVTDGKVAIFNFAGSTDVVVDVVGVFTG